MKGQTDKTQVGTGFVPMIVGVVGKPIGTSGEDVAAASTKEA